MIKLRRQHGLYRKMAERTAAESKASEVDLQEINEQHKVLCTGVIEDENEQTLEEILEKVRTK